MGLSAALELLDEGHEVTVLEAADRAGGLAGSFDFGGVPAEKFYHFLCGADRVYFRWLDRLGLSKRLRWRRTSMAVYRDERLYPFGDPVSLLRFSPLSLSSRIRYGLQVLSAKRRNDWKSLEDVPARDWLIEGSGEEAYRVVWEPLLRQKFASETDNISAAWIWSRIHRLASSRDRVFREWLGFLDGGSDVFVEALVQAIASRGGRIELGSPVEKVFLDGPRAQGVRAGGRDLPADAIVSTIPLSFLVRIAPALPASYREAALDLGNVGVRCIVLKLARSLTPYFWINVNDDLPVCGLIEYTNLNPPGAFQGKTLLYSPLYVPATHPRYRLSDEEVLSETLESIARIEPRFESFFGRRLSRLSRALRPAGLPCGVHSEAFAHSHSDRESLCRRHHPPASSRSLHLRQPRSRRAPAGIVPRGDLEPESESAVMRPARGLAAVVLGLALGAAAASSVSILSSPSYTLAPGEPGFRRLVAGATPSGRILARALISLPGFPRFSSGEVRLEVDGAAVRFGVEGSPSEPGPPLEVRPDRNGILLMEIPRAATPGARLVLSREEGEPPLRLRQVRVEGSRSLWPSLLALFATLVVASSLAGWKGMRLGIAAGLAMAAFTALAATPALLWLCLPSAWALVRFAPVVLLLVGSVVVGRRSPAYGRAVALLAALVLGCWVRWYFLPSAGSWDTEYWKAWMTRAVSEGVSGVYGDAGATPPGHFTEQLLGHEELFRVDYKGRAFVVDYPPGAMALWRWSWLVVHRVVPELDRAEAENVAVKLPAVAGDVAAVLLLLWLFRERPARGLALAALYWALPVSWLSSAVLGFLDGAYAPLAVLGLVAASRGRAGWAGALVALAGLIKPQGLIVAPAALVALWMERASVLRAVSSGLGIVAIALVPFALAGTLSEAVVHVFRILFQQRLSAGYANLWWIVGHLANGGALDSPVDYATLASVPFRAGLVGTGLFALTMVFILYRLEWRMRKLDARLVCLAGASIIFAYANLAMGVHENHPHAMFLAFAATGLAGARVRGVVSALSATYVLNMLSLSGLGRFYGLRYMAVEPIAAARVRAEDEPWIRSRHSCSRW